MKGKKFKVTVGDILSSDTERYRVLQVGANVVTIMMDTSKLIIKSYSQSEIRDKIENNEWSIIPNESNFVFDSSMASDSATFKYNKLKNACEAIRNKLELEGYEEVSYSRNNSIREFAKLFDIQEYTLRRVLRKYLQSGFADSSLVDQRCVVKPERLKIVNGKVKKDPAEKQRVSVQDMENMKKYCDLYKTNKYMKIKDAYSSMLNDCYRDVVISGNTMEYNGIREDRPSYNQFRYYINGHLTKEERDRKVMKPHEQRNNKRILTGSSASRVRYPGEVVEIDECDFPVSLVSKYDNTQTVGRPNVYMMIDVLTHVILAVGIAYNQNSYVGLTNMFINLSDDKVEYCKKYGVSIKHEDWPSNIIPARIRCDQGADFKGDDILKVCKSLHIERNLEPIATGSMKGEIENLFHLLQSNLRSMFATKGLITKDWGSKHHTEACITIESFTQILLLQIIEHNRRSMAEFPMTEAMIADGVLPRPYMLWDYYSRTVQSPQPIVNKNQYLLSLMKVGRASVDRKGVHYLGRTYFPVKDEAPDLWNQMYNNGNRKTYIDIHYDPRSMNAIYYVSNNSLICMSMTADKRENVGFFDMSEQEIERINAERRKIRREEDKYNEILRADTALLMSKSLEANQTKYKPTKDNMREERHAEKTKIAQESYDLQSRLFDETPEIFDDSNARTTIESSEDVAELSDNQNKTVEVNVNKSDDELFEDFLRLQREVNKQ